MRQKSIGIIILYATLTLLLTYPVFWQIGQAVAGFDGRDPFQHVWYQWWLKAALLEWGSWLDQVSHLYYPLKISHPVLALHPYVPLVSLPFTVLFGPLASYNLAFLLSFILSGLTGYLLCRYISGQVGAALIGGLIFAFYPNRFGHAAAGHLLLTTNYFLPLYALSLLILLRRPSVKRTVWHGLITALLALAQPTHILYGIIPLFVLLVGHYLLANQSSTRRTLAWLGAATSFALLMTLPFAWPILRETQQAELAYLTPDNLTDHATDLLAFLMPSPYNPLLAKMDLIPAFAGSIVDGTRDLEEQLAYPGWVALGLALVAVGRSWQKAAVWLVLTLGCGLLSMGPLLKIGGEVGTLPLPYAWLARLPFFAWSRAPGRFNETVMLGVAVLASLGVAWLFDQVTAPNADRSGVRSPLAGGLLLIGLAAIILAEYLVIYPFPTERRAVSAYYQTLSGEVIDGGVLALPVTGSRRASNYAMYYQTIHGHPLVGGYIERDPPGTVELKEFANQLVSPGPEQRVFAWPDEAERRSILADLRVERLVAHPDLMTDQAARATLQYLPTLLGPPIFEDKMIQVYSLDAHTNHQLPAWQILPDQENWEVVREGEALRLKEAGFLFIYAAQAAPVELRFQVDGPAEPAMLVTRFNDSLEAMIPIEASADLFDEPVSLRKGLNTIWLATEPPEKIEFSEISVEPVLNASDN